MSVRDDLKAIGGGSSPSYDFNQGTYRGDNNDVDGVSIADGYCSGVVLDWARRVLQSGPERGSAYLNFTNKDKDPATLQRMGRAYAGHAATYVAETDKTKILNLLNSMLTRNEVNYNVYGNGVPVSSDEAKLLGKMWQVPGAPTSMFRNFNLQAEPAGTLTKSSIAYLQQNAAANQDHQLQPHNATGRLWQQFAANLDAQFAAQRGRDVHRPYSNMVVHISSQKRQYDSGGQANAALMNHVLHLRNCTIVSFGPDAGGSGHAVAVYQVSDAQFYFFDPNYGVYTYTKQQLQYCFQHLFWTPYIPAAPTVIDGGLAVYRRRDSLNDAPIGPWNRMGYTVFRV